MLSFPRHGDRDDDKAARQARQLEATLWFEKALELEQTGAPVVEIIGAYEKAVALDPLSAGAFVNLGTVYFHQRKWDEAERNYRKALEADPSYSLAHFNLGNLYDEKGDRSKAFLHYLMAIRLNPSYGDAHYNLALLYQSSGQALRAVRHWRAYLKIDPASPWAAIARHELDKLCRDTILTGSRSRTRILTPKVYPEVRPPNPSRDTDRLRPDTRLNPSRDQRERSDKAVSETNLDPLVASHSQVLCDSLLRPAARRCRRCARPGESGT
jgi:tetratricopeptide (TPR) repeat protein